MRRLRLLVPFALLTLVLGLVACGGGGNDDEDRVVEVIETSFTSTKPASCKQLSTQKFLEQTQYAKGKEALKACEEDAEEESEGDTDSVEVSDVVIEDSTATANATFDGGTFDGQTLSVSLVEEGGDWKRDEITGFVELDQEHLAKSIQEGFEGGQNGLEPAVAACAGKAFAKMPKAELEEVLLGGSSQPIVEIVEGCPQGQQ